MCARGREHCAAPGQGPPPANWGWSGGGDNSDHQLCLRSRCKGPPRLPQTHLNHLCPHLALVQEEGVLALSACHSALPLSAPPRRRERRGGQEDDDVVPGPRTSTPLSTRAPPPPPPFVASGGGLDACVVCGRGARCFWRRQRSNRPPRPRRRTWRAPGRALRRAGRVRGAWQVPGQASYWTRPGVDDPGGVP